MNSLRSQLDKARAEKENVEEQLTETQMMLQQEQREHKILAQSRAREMEQWTDEREKSLHVVEEMSREVNNYFNYHFLIDNIQGGAIEESEGRVDQKKLQFIKC